MADKLFTEHQKVKDGKAYTVRLFNTGTASIFSQPVNPKTGKGWQKSTHIANFENHTKAMWKWCKL